jgi:acyl-CoA dehydrogenase
MADQSFLAWPFFDEGHRQQAGDFERWVAEILPSLLAGADGDLDAVYGCVRRLVGELGNAGLLRACVPAAYGGVREKIDVRSLCLAREILGRASGLADFAFAMQGLSSTPIMLFGSEDQKRAILPGIARGTIVGAFALSEPDAGSDVGAIATRATREDDCWRLDGVKTWISNAGLADRYVVFARTGEAPGTKGLSAFIVDADTPGLDASERIDVIAPHPLGTLRFTECRIAADRLLGKAGEGFKIAMATLDVFRSTVGAAALGFARRAFDEGAGTAFARARVRPRARRFELTEPSSATWPVSVDAAALLVYRAAWTRDVLGTRITREASVAKLFATESAQQVIDAAVQIFGGLGVVRGMTVERLYREIRALRIYEGASEVLKLVIASRVLETMAAQATASATSARSESGVGPGNVPGKSVR